MPIAPFIELLDASQAEGRAVGAFTCYDLLTAQAVLQVAAEHDRSVILLISAQAAAAPTGPGLIAGLLALAAQSERPASLQLDHCADLELIRRVLQAGVGGVMADGSKLPDAENAELVRAVVELARPYRAAVEAELGHVAGDEEVARATRAGALTDPEGARAFLRQTSADCLAVSIGNVHGTYHHPPELDFDCLAAIRERVSSPLCLHGASGLSAGDVGGCVRRGVAKVNVNNELRARWFADAQRFAPALAEGARLLALHQAIAKGIGEVVAEMLAMLEGVGG